MWLKWRQRLAALLRQLADWLEKPMSDNEGQVRALQILYQLEGQIRNQEIRTFVLEKTLRKEGFTNPTPLVQWAQTKRRMGVLP